MAKMDTLNDRIKFLFEKNGLNAYTFYVKTGFDQATMGRILKGETKKPSTNTIESIANYFNVSSTWILTGKGEMENTARSAPTTPPPNPPPEVKNLPVYDFTNEQRINLLLIQNAETQKQNDRLLTLLEKQEETIRINSLTINTLSANTSTSKNVEGQAS